MSIYSASSGTQADLLANCINRNHVLEVIQRYCMPKIGTVKYLARSSYTPSGLTVSGGVYTGMTSAFKGWVPANGALFSKTAFAQAYAVFGNTYGESGDSFRIPNLTNYYAYLDPTVRSGFQFVPCSTSVPVHSHPMTIRIKCQYGGVIKDGFKFYSCSGGGFGSGRSASPSDGNIPYLHQGSGNARPVYNDLKISANANFSVFSSDFPVGSSSSPNCEPKHNVMTTLIFVGVNLT